MKPILVTGAAGFIGFHLCNYLLDKGRPVAGLDGLNGYYSPALKQARLRILKQKDNFYFTQLDMADKQALNQFLLGKKFSHIIHLAAQTGMRDSLNYPDAYIHSNIRAFTNLLEACRLTKPRHLIYGSSSSIYGLNKTIPFAETNQTEVLPRFMR